MVDTKSIHRHNTQRHVPLSYVHFRLGALLFLYHPRHSFSSSVPGVVNLEDRQASQEEMCANSLMSCLLCGDCLYATYNWVHIRSSRKLVDQLVRPND